MSKFVQKDFRYVWIVLTFLSFPASAWAQDPLPTDSIYSEEILPYVEEEKDSLSPPENISQNPIDFLDEDTTQKIIAIRHLEQDFIQKIKNNKAFDYVKTGIPKAKKNEPSKSIFPDINIQLILQIMAIIVFILILFWYLKNNSLLLFKKKPIGLSGNDPAPDNVDIFSTNFEQAILEAMTHQHFRQAIRLHYFQALKILKEKGLIQYMPEKTNFDYLTQVRSATFYPEFFTATRHYEYSWYGLFDIDASKYARIKNDFVELKNKIGK
ncbi:MAG TPA: hypothetical protein PKY86_06420 [Niabella sp.]|nr:hypothetical protein [Niabella sp.]HQW14363.1 hypothetical protein [Niabella sp.]HQX18358.1 hypothetical protein [Niabella sp.]HQX40150.1 hypothetical protein [Niabella sp.]HRB05883.1 hypothetical protein [Niabella sp.]